MYLLIVLELPSDAPINQDATVTTVMMTTAVIERERERERGKGERERERERERNLKLSYNM